MRYTLHKTNIDKELVALTCIYIVAVYFLKLFDYK